MGSCQKRVFRAGGSPMRDSKPIETAIVAVPETAASALYGMLDVLSVTGNVWQTRTRTEPTPPPFRVRVVSVDRQRFSCGNGIPVEPAAAIHEMGSADIVILPELWLGLFKRQYPQVRFRPEPNLCFADPLARIHRGRHDVVARPRAAHHLEAREPGRGNANREGLPAEMA
jgi:transcriptional regulator GlxA family with amidase domain